MTYEDFALLAANHGLRAAWDALVAESEAQKDHPYEGLEK